MKGFAISFSLKKKGAAALTTITIELSDSQLAALQAKAEAQGLSLGELIQKPAEEEDVPPRL